MRVSTEEEALEVETLEAEIDGLMHEVRLLKAGGPFKKHLLSRRCPSH